VTPNRAFVLTIPFLLGVEAGIFYGLAALGAGGRTVVAVEMLWLVVAVFLACLFMGRYEHEGSDDRGD
jgi:nitrate/nitrite transporter NarK